MCVVKGPAQGAIARTKEVKPEGKVHILPPKRKPKAQAKNEDQHPRRPHYELAYDPPLLRARDKVKEDEHPQLPYYEPVGDLMMQVRAKESPIKGIRRGNSKALLIKR